MTDDTRMRAAFELKHGVPANAPDVVKRQIERQFELWADGYRARAAESSSGAARAEGLSDQSGFVRVGVVNKPDDYPKWDRFEPDKGTVLYVKVEVPADPPVPPKQT